MNAQIDLARSTFNTSATIDFSHWVVDSIVGVTGFIGVVDSTDYNL